MDFTNQYLSEALIFHDIPSLILKTYSVILYQFWFSCTCFYINMVRSLQSCRVVLSATGQTSYMRSLLLEHAL